MNPLSEALDKLKCSGFVRCYVAWIIGYFVPNLYSIFSEELGTNSSFSFKI